MAGSLKWQRYRDDSGVDYSVNVDESNAAATCGGVALCPVRSSAHSNLPTKLKKRYVNAYLTSNPAIRRRFWVGNPLAIPQILAGAAFIAAVYPASGDTAVAGVPWTIASYRGEKNAPPPALNTTSGDTGLTDGSPARD